MNLRAAISHRYRRPILIGACFQVGFLFLGALTFDLGQMFQWALIATVAYWIVATLILLRRPQTPTSSDLVFLRSGFVIILPLTILLTSFIWSWRDL
jgi:hypothetical protein